MAALLVCEYNNRHDPNAVSVRIDGKPVGSGEIGPVAREMLTRLLEDVREGVHSGDA